MTTLEQFLFEKTWIAPRERKEIVEAVKEWIQQKQQFAIKGNYRPEIRVYNELLEELEEEKEKQKP